MCEATNYGRNECQAHHAPGSVNDLWCRMMEAYGMFDLVKGDELRKQWDTANQNVNELLDLLDL